MKPEIIQFPDRTRPEAYRQPVSLTQAEIDYYNRRARVLRSRAYTRVFKAAAIGLGRTLRSLHQWLNESHDRRSAISELRRLSDRTLQDIGLQRSEIPYIVDRMLEQRKADGDSNKTYPVQALAATADTAEAVADDECCPPLAA